MLPGIGVKKHWTIYALNYLYACGEAERILLEVAAQNASTDIPLYHYTVDAVTKDQKYRITYIPLLLILGLISTVGAGAITWAMLFYSWATHSAQSVRRVDGLRLVVDSISGLRDFADEMEVARTITQADLDKWANRFHVQYQEVGEKGNLAVRLRRTGAGS
ncbi:hypothetical protein BDW74DRAFT_183968 [Aspergillus multicolor]|uniref:uncharacterized protein n=1 Tax=Aspergillus multicolor TaxID=41759 RepID=UPI003CCE4ADC